jgi:hypothetical protein
LEWKQSHGSKGEAGGGEGEENEIIIQAYAKEYLHATAEVAQ